MAGRTTLHISKNPCTVNDEPGHCMFNAECFARKGLVLGTCQEGFLFGACCSINPNASANVELLPDIRDPQVILNKIDELMVALKPPAKNETDSSTEEAATIMTTTTTMNTTTTMTTTTMTTITTAAYEGEEAVTLVEKIEYSGLGSAGDPDGGSDLGPLKNVTIDHENIEQMMNSLVDNVLETFDTRLPGLMGVLDSNGSVASANSTPDYVVTFSDSVLDVTTELAGDAGVETTTSAVMTESKLPDGQDVVKVASSEAPVAVSEESSSSTTTVTSTTETTKTTTTSITTSTTETTTSPFPPLNYETGENPEVKSNTP